MSNQPIQLSSHTLQQVTKNLLQNIDVTRVKELLPFNESCKNTMSDSWSKVIWSQCTN
jgi:hypothetical protein